jgi:ribosomal protein S14
MDKYKRSLFLKKEVKRLILKSVKLNKNTFFYRRYLSLFLLAKLPRFSSKTFKRNRCIISARGHGNTTKTGCNRFIIRTKAYNSELPGFRRASW